jgi:predicted O-methyltransferase YrrM
MFDAPDTPIKYTTHLEYFIGSDTPDIFALRAKQKALNCMDQLEGWCSHDKASILIDIILKKKPQKILEIGVFGGKSLVPMAVALQTNKEGVIYGIDPWDSKASIENVKNEANKGWWGNLDHEGILQGLIGKIRLFELDDYIQLIKSTSEDAAPIFDIDILHVDGNHSDKTSYLDVTKWVPYMRSGGWIIFDDMSWFEEGEYTTSRAVGWLDENCVKFAEFKDDCIWGIWIKP